MTLTVSGNDQYSVNGTGSLSFYGPAESSLGVSGNWQNYTATVTGNVSITLTVPAAPSRSTARPSPPGRTRSRPFGHADRQRHDLIAELRRLGLDHRDERHDQPRAGQRQLSVGGKPLNPDDETTLDGYTGTITVSANGDGTDSVSLNGNAGNVLQVTASPATLTTDQNTPITFEANVQTSLADTYTLTANAPPGWTVTIDSSGNVTATPAPGLQSGTYPIQIIAQSQTDSNLVAQTTVDVTITPTQPGINFAVAPDPHSPCPSTAPSSPRPSAPRSRTSARPPTPTT